MTTNVTRPCFTAQHQTCKTNTKTGFLVSGLSCRTTDGLRPRLWSQQNFQFVANTEQLMYVSLTVCRVWGQI